MNAYTKEKIQHIECIITEYDNFYILIEKLLKNAEPNEDSKKLHQIRKEIKSAKYRKRKRENKEPDDNSICKSFKIYLNSEM